MKSIIVLVGLLGLVGCSSAEYNRLQKQLNEIQSRQAITNIELQKAEAKMEYLRHHCQVYFPKAVADDEIK